MQKSLAVILSQYQLELFINVYPERNLENSYYITNSLVASNLKSFAPDSNIHVYDNPYVSLSTLRARAEIKGIKKFIKEKKISKNDILWIANDEHQVDQLVYNLVKFDHVNMIEDGIGSYIQHKFLKYNYGLLDVARKIKAFLNYFPYYRAFYGCGGNIQAEHTYSYYRGAFPSQNNCGKHTLEKEYKHYDVCDLAPDHATIFIGQPLVQLKYMSSEEYLDCIKIAKKGLECGNKLIYKAHPLEKKLNYLEGLDIVIIKSKFIPVEDYIYSSGDNLRVYSFVSTSLLHIKNLNNVSTLISIKPKRIKKMEPYYKFLKDYGIQIVNS